MNNKQLIVSDVKSINIIQAEKQQMYTQCYWYFLYPSPPITI